MTVENATYLNTLNKAYPRNRDLIKEGDDHIRLVKSTLQNTFPGMDSAVTMGSSKLNQLDQTFVYEEATLNVNNSLKLKSDLTVDMGGNTLKNVGTPTETTDAVNLGYLRGAAMWPVGSIFMTVDSRNPSDILGFGTWEKFSAGRVIIGSGATTDINNETSSPFVNESTGGAFAVTLTENNLPTHSHGAGTLKASDAGEHQHDVDVRIHSYAVIDNNYWNCPHGDIAGENSRFQNTQGAKTRAGSGSHNHPIEGSTATTGKGEKFYVVQPYIVCNIWVRKPDPTV